MKPKNNLWDTASEIVIKQHPELGYRIPRSCVTEAAIGNGSVLQYHKNIPHTILEKLMLGASGKEKPLPLKDGKVSHINLQGHFRRLSEESAKMIEVFHSMS